MRLRSNIAAMAAAGKVGRTRSRLQDSLSKLASGTRIVRAADDAAGLAVATNLETQRRSLDVAMRNTNDGLSMLQTAEGAIGEMIDILQRIHELAIQSASETLADDEREFIQDEEEALFNEMDRIVGTTEFNGIQLLDGSSSTLGVQVGIYNTSDDRITLPLFNLDPNDLAGFAEGTTYSLDDVADARTNADYIRLIHIPALSRMRSRIGAVHNRLTSVLSHGQQHAESLAAAESRIMDTDFATETAELAKQQLLEAAGMGALAQAKNLNQSVLTLLG